VYQLGVGESRLTEHLTINTDTHSDILALLLFLRYRRIQRVVTKPNVALLLTGNKADRTEILTQCPEFSEFTADYFFR